jgi:hypothetical protein
MEDLRNDTLTYIDCLKNISQSYQTTNILLPFGDDFAFWNSSSTYHFLDFFLTTLNPLSSPTFPFELLYSTP